MSTNLCVYIHADETRFEYELDIVRHCLKSYGLRLVNSIEESLIHLFVLDYQNWESHLSELGSVVTAAKPTICLVKVPKTSVPNAMAKYFGKLPKPLPADDPELGIIRQGVYVYAYRTIRGFENGLKKLLIKLLVQWAERNVKPVQDPISMYHIAADVIRNTQHELVVVQQTSVLLLGCHPYGKRENKYPFEEAYLKELEGWIEKCLDPADNRRLIYLYDAPKTKADIDEEVAKGSDIRNQVRLALEKLYDYESQSEERIKIRSTQNANAMTIGDDWLGIWVIGKQEDPVAFTYADHQLAKRLRSRFRKIADTHKSLEDLKSELGLN